MILISFFSAFISFDIYQKQINGYGELFKMIIFWVIPISIIVFSFIFGNKIYKKYLINNNKKKLLLSSLFRFILPIILLCISYYIWWWMTSPIQIINPSL